MSLSELNLNVETDRRSLLRGAGLAGATLMLGGLLAGCGGSDDSNGSSANANDQQILGAAKIAEAIATTFYTGIIGSTIFAGLDGDDQDYFRAARDEEKFHYDLLKAATDNADAPLTYYFPTNSLTNLQTMLNVLVTLEDAFIAAYLVGVKDLSTSNLRVLAAQIMGVESDHRTLARVVAQAEGLTSVTGLSGAPENVNPPNNNVYERTYGVNSISVAVNALTPFFDATAAAAAGHTVTLTFDPAYVPTFPGLLGNPPS